MVDQWVTGEYWERHRVAKHKRSEIPARLKAKVEELKSDRTLSLFENRPWRTVRDAIADLPNPEAGYKHKILNHTYIPGARRYAGHTGSPLDEPAKALKAGDHGVPGGENMLVKPDGSLRYFTVRESARLQTFPDDYFLHGVWTEAMRQLGNAVPVLLGHTVASEIAARLVALR